MSESNIRNRLLAACQHALKPLVRILLRAGVSYQDFMKVSQKIFVDAVPEIYGGGDDSENDSLVSELTGIEKEKVKVIRMEQHPEIVRASAATHHAAATLLHFWRLDPEYQNPEGLPMHLPYSLGRKNFLSLAKQYGGGVTSGFLFKELIRSGAVDVDNDNKFFPTTETYLCADTNDALVDAISGRLYNFLVSVEENTSSVDRIYDTKRVERSVETVIPREKLEEVREVIRNGLTTYMKDLDGKLSLYENDDTVNVRRSDVLVGLGLYEIVGSF